MVKFDDVIPFNKPYIVGKELYYISQAVISNQQLSGDGPFTKLCQQWLEDAMHVRKALLTHSCTAALDMSALLCDIGPGDEVIMPSFTFVSTANAFVLRGGVPVFVDIREDTLNIDEQLISEAITKKTKVIVPVHYAGMPCNMDVIMALARDNYLRVVEDAAQGHLTTYGGRCLGSIGHLGCLSFHETKNIISGEGGALLVNDPELADRAEIIWEKGTNRGRFLRGEVDKYTWEDVGSSYLPSELTAAFLYAQLERADAILVKRRHILSRYMAGLKDLGEQGRLRLPCFDGPDACNGHIMYVITASLEERTALTRHLSERNIMALFHYVPLHSSNMGRRSGRVHKDMRVTDSYSERLLRLPIYYTMEDAEVDRVIEAVTDFYRRA